MRRLGGNEATFRDVNETLRAGKHVADARKLFPFRCECGVLGCNQILELTLPEYEAVRSSPTRFVIVPGHDIPGAEHVVAEHERYAVVEKEGEAAKVAVDSDPRA